MDAPWTALMNVPQLVSSLSMASSSSTQTPGTEHESSKGSSARTPLSSKAKPFRSSKTAGYCGAVAAGFADSTHYPYSPELQDYVYLNMGNMTPSVLSGEEGAGCASGAGLQPVDSSCEESVAPTKIVDRSLRIPSRTPSPEPRYLWSGTGRRLEARRGTAAADITDTAFSCEEMQSDPGLLRAPVPEKLVHGEDVQERRSLPGDLPLHVKRTFIHYDNGVLEPSKIDASRRPRHRSESAPARLLSRQMGRILEEHLKGTCKPCGYFFAKADGCRWHNTCTFCHLVSTRRVEEAKEAEACHAESDGCCYSQGCAKPYGPISMRLAMCSGSLNTLGRPQVPP